MMAAPMVAAGQVGCAPKTAVTYYPRTHLTYATLSPKPITSAFPSLLDSSSSEKQWARNCRSSGQESHGGFIGEASHYSAFPVHLNARSRRTVCMRPAACPSVSSRGAALWIGSNCRGNYSCPRNTKWNSGDCEASHSSPSSWKRGRTARNIEWQISKMPNALSGPISTKPGSRKYQGSLSKRVMPHMAALQTGMKEGTFSAVENQNLEKAEAAWVFDEGQTFTGKVSENRIGAREASNDVPGEPETGDKLGLSEGAYMTVLEEGSALESVAVETATLMQQGSSSLATGRYSDEFQVSRFGIGFEDENNTAWEAAVAETAGILQQHGSSLKRLASGEGGTQVQTAVRETVKILQNGQGSFVRGRAVKKRPQGNLWDRLQNTGVGKHLFRDMQMVSGWAKRTADNTGITNIAAKDVICVNKMSEWVKEVVGPSLKNGIRDTVALKFLEIEDAVSTSPAPWPQPYYPELRGFEVMAADVDTLGKYVEHIKSVTRNFRVPLQNNYDPDQIAAYFDHRPHVLIFRLLEVFAAFGSVALQSRVQKAALLWKNGGNISEEENTQLTMQTAEALKQALLGLGTTFIKVAQSLSARPDIIGTETAKVLAELQDRLPPFPSDEAVAIIEEEFGCSLRKIFAYLSMEPVAAASFGQVYRGCTIDGLEVAVKVQRPDLLFSVARDVHILRIGLILLKRVANLSNNYALVADELGHALYGELDYRHEASNAAEFAAAHKHVPWMYVPKTLPHLTGRKVLVMEWLSGDRPFDLQCVAQGMQLPDGTVPTWEQQQEAKDRLLNMVNKGTEAALIQLLETGVMHADPHPGNILLSPDGTLQFIDFGLICHMEKKHQGAMLALIAHLVNGEWQSLTDDLADMDVLKPTTDRFAVRLALERSFGEGPNAVIKNGVPDFSFGQITKSFFKVAYKFRFRLPPYYTLVLRSLASLEGFGLAVNPDFKTFGAAYPYVVRRLLLDYSPTTQRVLHSLLLDEKRQLKWDRISSLVAISRKSAADQAALDMVIVPNSVPEVVNSGETQMQESSQTASNLVGLVLAKEGVGLRRVLLEADTCALALVFVSTRAAMLRRKVANAIGEGIFVMLCEKFSFEGAQSGPITRDASEDSSSSNFLPLSQSSTLQKRRRLEFLLKAMLGRLRGKILLFARVGWSFITIICWALAIACHRYAVYISNVFLPTDHKTGAGMSQGQVDEHTRIRNKQGVVPTPL